MYGAKEKTALLEMAVLPAFVFGDCSAFAFVLVEIVLLKLELHKLSKRIQYVSGKPQQNRPIIWRAGAETCNLAEDTADSNYEGKWPAKYEGPEQVEEEETEADVAARRLMNIGFCILLDRAILLIQCGLPYPDAEWMCFIDSLLAIFEGEALGIAMVRSGVIIVVIFVIFWSIVAIVYIFAFRIE